MRTNIRDICKIPPGISGDDIPAYLGSRIKIPSASDIAKMNTRLRKILHQIERRKRPDWNRLKLRFEPLKF